MSASTAASPADANSRQVGGNHYKTGQLEHWDLLPPAYLLGCASKYVSRHMEKGGRQDLEKAVHYCEKFAEVIGDKPYTHTLQVDRLLEWARGTRMTGYEIAICYEILCTACMEKAVQLLHMLLRLRYPEKETLMSRAMAMVSSNNYQRHLEEGREAVNKPGTPEDGGHHARQAPDPDKGEDLQRWDYDDYRAQRLPPSLSTHEWQHRCSCVVQEAYEYNVNAARYLIKDDLRHYTHHYTARD